MICSDDKSYFISKKTIGSVKIAISYSYQIVAHTLTHFIGSVLGTGFSRLVLTFNGRVLSDLDSKEDAAKAIALQIGALYTYGKY